MGMAGKILRLIRRTSPSPMSDRTREYWEDASGGSADKAISAICDGYGREEFERDGTVHFGESCFAPGMRVLDLACGMGRTCRRVAGLVGEYHGVDSARGMVEKAREYNKGVPNAAFHVNDGMTLAGFGDGTFDVVYSELAFQHMPKSVQRSYAAEAARVLGRGGLFFAQLPRMDFYNDAEYALTEGEARSLLSPFCTCDIGQTKAYYLARAEAC